MICGKLADGDKLAEEAHALLTRVAVVTTGFTWARTQAHEHNKTSARMRAMLRISLQQRSSCPEDREDTLSTHWI